MLSVVVLSDVMQNVVIQNVVILSVAASFVSLQTRQSLLQKIAFLLKKSQLTQIPVKNVL
jgi:hypothetical protein